MRQYIAKFGLPVSVILLLCAGIYAYVANRHANGSRISLAFYVDENTGEESVQPATAIPPLLNRAGQPTLVREVKFSCDGGTTIQVAYWEKLTKEAQLRLEDKSTPLAGEIMLQGMLVRSPEPGSPWVPETSAEGETVLQRVNCPAGSRLMVISPPGR